MFQFKSVDAEKLTAQLTSFNDGARETFVACAYVPLDLTVGHPVR